MQFRDELGEEEGKERVGKDLGQVAGPDYGSDIFEAACNLAD